MPTLTDHDFPSFVCECHRICYGEPLEDDSYSMQALAKDTTAAEFIVNLPPEPANKFIISISLAAWALARDPSARIMTIHHSNKQATESPRLIRQIVASEWFRRISNTC